jgi:thymidine kinase
MKMKMDRVLNTEGVKLITGSMFAKKSKVIMDLIEAAHNDKSTKYLVFKPTSDTRDGLYIKSRVYNRVVPALAWDQNYEEMKMIFNYTISGFSLTNPDEHKIVFFDEIHFLSKTDVSFIITTCLKYGVTVVFAGLESSFKLEEFESTKYIRMLCDYYEFLHGTCNFCGKDEAVFNLLYDQDNNRVTSGKDIQPGDLEYKVCCEKCKREHL